MTQIGRMAGSIWQPAPLTNQVNIPAVLVAGSTATQNSPFVQIRMYYKLVQQNGVNYKIYYDIHVI